MNSVFCFVFLFVLKFEICIKSFLSRRGPKSVIFTSYLQASEAWLLGISVCFFFFFLSIIKCQTKIAADDTLFFYFYVCKEIRLDVSRESSA